MTTHAHSAITRFNRRYPRIAAHWEHLEVSAYERRWISIVRLGAAARPLIGRMDAWYRARTGKRPVETDEDYQRYLAARDAEQGRLFA